MLVQAVRVQERVEMECQFVQQLPVQDVIAIRWGPAETPSLAQHTSQVNSNPRSGFHAHQ